MNYLNDGGTFLVNAIFGLYIFCLLIRFWMHINRVDFRNPVGQFLVQISNPLLSPLKKFISSNQGFAYAVLAIATIITEIKFTVLLLMQGATPSPLGVLVISVADIIQSSIYIFIGAVLINIISSWIAPQGGYNPFLAIVRALSEPIMAPARRLIPAFGGLDLSPILVMIFLQLSLIIIVQPIFDLGSKLL